MRPRKILHVGSQLGVALPQSLVRAMGWCAGDSIFIYKRDGDIVIRNDTKRTAQFVRVPPCRREQRIEADAR